MGAMIREDRFGVVSKDIDVASVAADTVAEQDFTITGLKVGDYVAVCKPSLSAGLGVVNARVKAADTLSIQFVNATDTAIDPTSETYLIFWFRAELTTPAVSV
jgi:O-succinylbenzoate synthase